ncbi:MAG: type II secretion system F family protein [Lentisphaeria bacterium]|nr:type II secretion system F family protein [Lentisphaeria bacterium]
MPKFDYQAKRGPAETLTGHLEADSHDEAVRVLVDQGLTPVRVSETVRLPVPKLERSRRVDTVSGGNPRPAGTASRLKIKSRELDRLTRQLATLIRTNVPILRALNLIKDQCVSPHGVAEMVGDLREQVKQGKQLSDALRKYPRVFDELYVNMVVAGERGGVLHQTLTRLADHREKELETRRRIQAAMAYPSFVVAAGLLTVFVVVSFILPKIIYLFEGLDDKLPASTKLLIATTHFMRGNWLWFAGGVLLVVLMVSRGGTDSWHRRVTDMLKLRTPVINKLVRHAEIAKFTRTMSLLIDSGLSVQESLNLGTATIQNLALRSRMDAVGTAIVNRGATLSASLASGDVFPPFAVNMIMVGEESGELSEALREVAMVYDREVEQSIKLLVSLLEPLLIVLVGGIVAFIVFAMLMPIFEIGTF